MTTDHRPPTNGKFPVLLSEGNWSVVGGHWSVVI
jgi:hypothetical protein